MRTTNEPERIASRSLVRLRVEAVARGIAKSHNLDPDENCKSKPLPGMRKVPFWKLFTSDARKILRSLDALSKPNSYLTK